jgi:hypothetical protein
LLDKIAAEGGFSNEVRKKPYLGIPELRLMFEDICKMEKSRFCYKQHYLLWTLLFMTGARPGCIVLSTGYQNTMQCLLWEDIQFIRHLDHSGISVSINFRWVKGRRNAIRDGDASFKGATFFISPCRDAINVIADPTWMLLQIAVERGLFTQSYDELLNSTEFILTQDPIITKQAVFIRQSNNVVRNTGGLGHCLPMCISAVPSMLQKTLRGVGIVVEDASPYGFRRESITAIGRTISKEFAQQYAGHRVHTAWEHYDFGIGDQDITPLRLEEDGNKSSSNQLRQLLVSPAITSRKEYSIHDCNAWIRDSMNTNPVLIEFKELIGELQEAVAGTVIAHNTDYELPDSLDEDSPKSWRENVPQDPYTPAYLAALRKASDKARNWTQKNLRALYNREWASSAPVADRDEVLARMNKVKTIPACLQQDQDGIDDEDSRELQPAFQDAIDSFDGPVGLLMPGEDEEPLPNQESADSVRARCYHLWEELKDNVGGQQMCPLCLADPFGLRTIHDTTTRVNRHIEGSHSEHADDWNPMESYIDGLKQDSGLYLCRVASELSGGHGKGKQKYKNNSCGQKGLARIPMRNHMRVHHLSLFERLGV